MVLPFQSNVKSVSLLLLDAFCNFKWYSEPNKSNIKKTRYIFHFDSYNIISKSSGVAIFEVFNSQPQPFSAKLWPHGRTAKINTSLYFDPPQLQPQI